MLERKFLKQAMIIDDKSDNADSLIPINLDACSKGEEAAALKTNTAYTRGRSESQHFLHV